MLVNLMLSETSFLLCSAMVVRLEEGPIRPSAPPPPSTPAVDAEEEEEREGDGDVGIA